MSDDGVISQVHTPYVYTRPCIVFYSEIAVSVDVPLYLPGYTVPPGIDCGGYGCDDVQ